MALTPEDKPAPTAAVKERDPAVNPLLSDVQIQTFSPPVPAGAQPAPQTRLASLDPKATTATPGAPKPDEPFMSLKDRLINTAGKLGVQPEMREKVADQLIAQNPHQPAALNAFVNKVAELVPNEPVKPNSPAYNHVMDQATLVAERAGVTIGLTPGNQPQATPGGPTPVAQANVPAPAPAPGGIRKSIDEVFAQAHASPTPQPRSMPTVPQTQTGVTTAAPQPAALPILANTSPAPAVQTAQPGPNGVKTGPQAAIPLAGNGPGGPPPNGAKPTGPGVAGGPGMAGATAAANNKQKPKPGTQKVAAPKPGTTEEKFDDTVSTPASIDGKSGTHTKTTSRNPDGTTVVKEAILLDPVAGGPKAPGVVDELVPNGHGQHRDRSMALKAKDSSLLAGLTSEPKPGPSGAKKPEHTTQHGGLRGDPVAARGQVISLTPTV